MPPAHHRCQAAKQPPLLLPSPVTTSLRPLRHPIVHPLGHLNFHPVGTRSFHLSAPRSRALCCLAGSPRAGAKKGATTAYGAFLALQETSAT